MVVDRYEETEKLIKDGTKSYFNPFKPKSIISLIMDASSCAASLWGRGWCFWSKQVSICCFEVKNKKEEAFMLGCLKLLSSLLEKWHNTKKKKKNYRKNNMFLETKRCVTPFHIFVLSLPLVAKKLHKGANTQIKPIKVLLERQNTWLKCNDLAFKNSCHV